MALNLSAAEVIRGALRDAAIVPIEQPIESIDFENGLDRLNIVLKQMQSQGLHEWTRTQGIIPLVKGQRKYDLGPQGNHAANTDDFFSLSTTLDHIATDTVINLTDTSNIDGAPFILPVDPARSTTGWVTGNGATLSVSGAEMTITNGAASQGFADYTLDTTTGTEYIVEFDYIQGTSTTFDYIIQDVDGVIDSGTLTPSQGVQITFTARQIETTLTMQNGSATLGHTSTFTNINYLDTASGDNIGIYLDDGSRYWSHVVFVDSATQVFIRDALPSAAASGNSVYTYTDLIPRPMRILQAQYADRFDFSEIPTTQWNRTEYFDQPDKDSSGTVVYWYYSPQLDNGEVYVWQVASSDLGVLRFDYTRPINITMDFLDSPDLPSEWYNPIKWTLAAELGPQYGVPQDKQLILEAKAKDAMALALDYDVERGDMHVQPTISRS